MIIKLVKVQEVKKGEYKFKRIVGMKADGTQYEKDIAMFKSNQDLLNTLDGFGAGQFMELKYDSTRFKNVESIAEASGFPDNPVKTEYKNTTAPQQTARKADGTSRGDDTNRASAIYLAKEVVLATHDPKVLKTISPEQFVELLTQVANGIHDYIVNGTVASSNATTTDETLDPPNVE